MAERKQLTCNSFVFYGSFYEAISVLPAENQSHIYDAIFKFAFENIQVELDGVELAVFLLIRPQLEANRTKYENGCKGGAPRGNQNARKKTTEVEFESLEENNQKTTENNPKTTEVEFENNRKQPNENDNENVNDNKKENTPCGGTKEKAIRFFAPTLDEVKKYCQERKNSVDAERFWNFYESKGWMVGKTKMKDWKAAVRTWETEDKPKTVAAKNQLPSDHTERVYSADEMKTIVSNIDTFSDEDL